MSATKVEHESLRNLSALPENFAATWVTGTERFCTGVLGQTVNKFFGFLFDNGTQGCILQ